MDGFTVAAGLMILVGLIGIALPVLPGLLLVWGGVLLWASELQTRGGWVVLGIATLLALAGVFLQYLIPGRRMRTAGVTALTTFSGVVLAVVGFFVIPVVGAVLGFVLGVYLAERVKHGSHAASWPSTKHALKAVALSVGIELAAGLVIAGTWVIGVILT